MKPIWRNERAQRPDPYLDWELRTRPGSLRERSDDQWCSVYVEIKPGQGNEYLENFRRLVAAVDAGRLEEDPSGTTIRMADDEREHLEHVEKAIESGTVQPDVDRVLTRFFVYRLESLIYSEGSYASTELYDVILAGPPIAGLKFNMLEKRAPDPTKFNRSDDTDLRGVAIGIIDDGIAFAHERFRSGPDTSRVMAIWLQEVERERPDDRVAFGRRLNNEKINALLKGKTEDEVYRSIGLTNFGKNKYNPLAGRATHGTHVLDVAAGYDPDIPSDEVRPILAVQLPSIATLDTSGVTMGSYVLQAVRQIMLWADALGRDVPLVINFSYGLSAGPKDGTHDLERALRDLISCRNKRASTCLVLPAGNTYRARTTSRMTLAGEEAQTLDWMILPDDQSPNFLEIWLDAELGGQAASPIEVSLTPPDGLPSDAARPAKGTLSVLFVDDKPIAAAYYSISQAGRGRIFLAVNQTASHEGRVICAPAGRWRLTLKNTSDREIVAHLYIQRDSTPFGYRRPGRQSFFDHPDAYCRDEATGAYDRLDNVRCPITHNETLSALATSAIDNQILVVGAADASQTSLPAPYTSSGPTKLREGPDCSAVTEEGRAHWGVLAAGTFGGSMVRMSGTSVAAPQLVRKIANDFAVIKQSGRIAQNELDSLSREPAIGVSNQDIHPAASADLGRLGKFVIQRRPNRRVPRRRYPAQP